MAIARSNSGNLSAGASPFTTSSFTVNSGESLVVGVMSGAGETGYLTSVVWNGGSQTMTASKQFNAGGGNGDLYICTLLSPTAGTSTLTLTKTGGGSGYLMYATYTGVGSIGATSGVSNSTSPLTDTITTTTANAWTFLLGIAQSGTPTASTGLTRLRLSDFSFGAIFDSNGAIASPGNYAQSFTATTSLGDASIELIPTGGGAIAFPDYYYRQLRMA